MSRNIFVVALALAIPLASCDEPNLPLAPQSISPRFTASSGSVSTVIGRGTFGNPVSVSRRTGDWKVKVESDPMDVAVQSIVFQAGGQSGWHRHPGPVFILVVEGTMTFYESDDPHCRPIVRSAGQGYLDNGAHAHIARNETQHVATNVVTYFAPPAAALRIDAPKSAYCAF